MIPAALAVAFLAVLAGWARIINRNRGLFMDGPEDE